MILSCQVLPNWKVYVGWLDENPPWDLLLVCGITFSLHTSYNILAIIFSVCHNIAEIVTFILVPSTKLYYTENHTDNPRLWWKTFCTGRFLCTIFIAKKPMSWVPILFQSPRNCISLSTIEEELNFPKSHIWRSLSNPRVIKSWVELIY